MTWTAVRVSVSWTAWDATTPTSTARSTCACRTALASTRTSSPTSPAYTPSTSSTATTVSRRSKYRPIRCHTCDFVAPLRNFRKSQTLRLSSCRRCDFVAWTSAASAPLLPFHDPPSQTQFQNDEIVHWSHAFVLQNNNKNNNRLTAVCPGQPG